MWRKMIAVVDQGGREDGESSTVLSFYVFSREVVKFISRYLWAVKLSVWCELVDVSSFVFSSRANSKKMNRLW